MSLLGGIPAQQKQIVLVKPDRDLSKAKFEVRVVDVPKPQKGEVLVKMVAAPVNPSDFGTWMQTPADAEPACIGNEGCGVVVASGGGLATWCKVGKSVGVITRGKGSYQQYVAVNAMTGIFPLEQTMDTKDGASFFVNPYTAVGIVDTVKQRGATAFVHTGASSQLGQMLVKFAPSQGVTVVNVVRREEQAEMLRNIGAEHVIVQKEGWEKELGAMIRKLEVSVAFDCVSGDTTGTIVSLMPKKSVTFVYGALSEKPVGGINPMDLIYHQKEVVGWLLPNWLQSGGTVKMLLRARKAAALVNPALTGGWAASQFEDVSMEEWFQKFLSMREQRGNGGFTGRKLRIMLESELN